MNVDYLVGQLQNASDWTTLAECLGGSHRVVRSIIRHLMVIGARSYLIESRYIDRDYSSDYRRFYAQTFKTYPRHCKRVHFFAEDLEPIGTNKNWIERTEALQKTSKRSYLGFCVVRPLPNAPIGRTALRGDGPAGPDIESVVTCRARVRANLLGAELDVVGACFMQQDSRVGACAQVAIWTGARHMHHRHKYNWLSVADITRLAVPSTAEEATSLPAGSDFLTSERMIRAIHEMGFQPLCVEGANIGDAILPYVESGLPVILGLQDKSFPGSLGHAVTVIGQLFAKQKTPGHRLADYFPAYIVHDDQAGPYVLLPKDAHAAAAHSFDSNQLVRHRLHGMTQIELNVADHAVFAVVLMPVRAFSTASAAERTAWGRLNATLGDMKNIRAKLTGEGVQVDDRLLSELIEAHKKKRIVMRTYLTSASGYRMHIARSTASSGLKDRVMRLHLPHFTWITEISTVDSYNQASPGFRRMYGHSILDATSTGKDAAGLLALHIPGILTVRDVEAEAGEDEKVFLIKDDGLYECREKRFTH